MAGRVEFGFSVQGVFVYESIVINVVYDKVHVAIVIQVGINATGRKSRLNNTPVFRLIVKLVSATVPKSITRRFYYRERICSGKCSVLFYRAALTVCVKRMVKVGNIARVAIGNYHIPIAVVIIVGN